MRVLLVNTNRFLEPPVAPLGLEYVAHYLEREGHDVRVADLAFEEDPRAALRGAVRRCSPEVVGITLRNSDTCLFLDRRSFLEEARSLVRVLREETGAPVVVGGSGLLAGPREVAEYLGCDIAVWGPGERAFPRLLERLRKGDKPPRLINGWDHSFDRGEVPRRAGWVDYGKYLENRGLLGFVFQVGCLERCSFCLEGGLPWKTRDPGAVVEELRLLREDGYREFHLCDSEFNQDLESCKEFLARLRQADLDLSWTLYMKPLPFDRSLFRLLSAAGAESLTLSVDSLSLARGVYGLEDVRAFIGSARGEGIRVAVDLLVGFPGERLQETGKIIDFFRSVRPDTVGVNAWIRLYKYTEMGRRWREGRLEGAEVEGEDPDCLQPVYYRGMEPDVLRSLLGDDPLFRVEGEERRSNYERLRP